ALIRSQLPPNSISRYISLRLRKARGRVRETLWRPKHIDRVYTAAIGNVGRVRKRANQYHGRKHQELNREQSFLVPASILFTSLHVVGPFESGIRQSAVSRSKTRRSSQIKFAQLDVREGTNSSTLR